MELYISIVNGQPFEHPIFGDNFKQAFPEIDVNNLPPEFSRFERIEPPTLGLYEVYEGVTYAWVDGIVKDVHHVRPMTEEEIIAKQTEIAEGEAESQRLIALFKEQKLNVFQSENLGVTRV
jgi:hypothetical protein